MADRAAIALCDFSGNVVAEATALLPGMGTKAVLDWTEQQLATLTQRRPAILAGIGIAVTGSFVGERVGFNTPFYLNEWAEIDIEQLFRERFKLPTYADNNGNVAALCESMLGVGRWAKSFAYLYISAGVGGGIVLDGEVWRGRHGNAGEFAGGLPTNIYPFPNLELLRQITAKHGPVFDTVSELVDGFDPRWPSIDEWIVRVRDSLSIIASNATAILDLDAIVLGGLMPKALAERVIPAIELYDQKRRMVPRPVARLVPAEAPGNPAAIGAALLPLKSTFFAPAARAVA